ncbi:phage repressor protein C with HTH and peptisase S24 domain [Methylorubrum rhodinum]|uniref:Phage repressor protein C with HTH and peptisase S24 domain n=1 Tax=Methylorubrum rhodinum TaxID=29428 RepID=A0A840ZLC1_9HYPH|nr:helix-turn-helix domain-containing protein [Methylorubrum rhodinum]MBB5758819.1 phage repressor protein C with HTH and peptisase S24 domain [Methylorubrum rhodinum]
MTWHDQIREARTKRGLSQGKLAKAVGVSQAIIGKIELRQVESTKALGALIEFLGLDRADFPEEAFGQVALPATDSAPTEASPLPLPEYARDPAYWAMAAGLVGDVPLYAAAEGGAGTILIDRDSIGSERRPPELQGVKNGYAILVVGTSMTPEFEPGDTLYINPRLPVIPNTSCVFYSNKNEEPTATVKRFLGERGDMWLVRQHEPKKDFELDAEEWAVRHRIVSKKLR